MELDPIELLIYLIKLFIFMGIIFLIAQGFYYLGNLIYKPIIYMVSIIGNIIMHIFNFNIAPFGTFAIILFIATGILWLGSFLNDEEKILAYEILTFIIWFIDGIITLAAYLDYQSNPTLLTSYIGFGFLGLIAPPFIYIIANCIKDIMSYLFDFLFY